MFAVCLDEIMMYALNSFVMLLFGVILKQVHCCVGIVMSGRTHSLDNIMPFFYHKDQMKRMMIVSPWQAWYAFNGGIYAV